MRFLEKLGLDEKTKFLLETTGYNLIDLDKVIEDKQVSAD